MEPFRFVAKAPSRSYKSQIRSSKQFQMSKIEICLLWFVSGFDIRISGLYVLCPCPYVLSGFHNQLELAPLFVLGKQVTLHSRSEAALRTYR